MSDEEANKLINQYLAEKDRLVRDQRHAGDEDEERDGENEERDGDRLLGVIANIVGWLGLLGLIYLTFKYLSV